MKDSNRFPSRFLLSLKRKAPLRLDRRREVHQEIRGGSIVGAKDVQLLKALGLNHLLLPRN